MIEPDGHGPSAPGEPPDPDPLHADPLHAEPLPADPPGPAPPGPPPWTKAYELPTARKVVGAGLHLATTSSAAIRRASLYIGLLSLGAFGPTVVLFLIGIGRLMSDPATADTMATDPTLILFEQPDLMQPLLVIYSLALVGVVLLVAISIDAQAIAIALLGGIAAEHPLRLREAVARARQTFWRLAGAGLMVGIASAVVTFVVAMPFLRPFDTNTGVSFIASMVGTLVVTPFAFAATGIVLGDVGAVEALQRSMALFRARPRIAFAVVLFTLVTSAIQTFAISAGLDVAVRVSDLLGLGLEQDGLGLVLPAIIVLGFIMAFGSLTFTVAAIVAAPQVAAFLGLTFYSGGLDKARADAGARPRRARWVTLPMAASMAGLALVAGLQLPAINAFEPRVASPLLAFLRPLAAAHGQFVTAFGPPALVEDAVPDAAVGQASFDIVAAEYGYLPEVPPWLLSSVFDCAAENVACSFGAPDPSPTTFANGAYLFVQRMAEPPGIAPEGDYGEWGPVVAVPGFDLAPARPGEPFANASHAIVTFVTGSTRSVRFLRYAYGRFTAFPSVARSTWIGHDLITLVPVVGEISADPESWDAYAHLNAGGIDVSIDTLRSTADGALLPFPGPPEYWLAAFDGTAP